MRSESIPGASRRFRNGSAEVALADSTRTRLLDAAGEVFAESGFQAATVREICARAGVNIALVNYHFGDKLELYTAVLRHSIGSARSKILQTALDPAASPENGLRDLIGAMLQRICGSAPGWHVRLMVHELARPTPAMGSVVDEVMRPIYDRFRHLIGLILNLPPDHDKTRLSTSSVIAQVVHYAHSKHVISRLWPELVLTPGRIDQIAAHIADFSLAYLNQAANENRPRAVTRSKERTGPPAPVVRERERKERTGSVAPVVRERERKERTGSVAPVVRERERKERTRPATPVVRAKKR